MFTDVSGRVIYVQTYGSLIGRSVVAGRRSYFCCCLRGSLPFYQTFSAHIAQLFSCCFAVALNQYFTSLPILLAFASSKNQSSTRYVSRILLDTSSRFRRCITKLTTVSTHEKRHIFDEIQFSTKPSNFLFVSYRKTFSVMSSRMLC